MGEQFCKLISDKKYSSFKLFDILLLGIYFYGGSKSIGTIAPVGIWYLFIWLIVYLSVRRQWI